MHIYQHQFSGAADLQKMAALARLSFSENLHNLDLPYRLSSWAVEDPENTCLWVDGENRLLAWAVLQSPWWTFDYTLHPQADPALHRQVLAWADERARQVSGTAYGHPTWFVTVFPTQDGRIRDLEEAGFASQANLGDDSWTKVLMQRQAEVPLRLRTLPPGFVVRPLAGESEVEAYVELHRAVFETKNMTVAWRKRTLTHSDYRPDLDLVIAAPDGRLAAFCVCWLGRDASGVLCGQVEPLGCHKDFRRYALGRVALVEGLRRLQSCGAQAVYVETDNYRNTAFLLYESVGFRVIQDVLVYGKNYPDPQSE